MFDENFSFLSSTSSTSIPSPTEPTSADISPFTSRCSSPAPQYHTSEVSKRIQRPRESRYDVYRPRHTSITTLTAQLESQDLAADHSIPTSPIALTSPSDFSSDGDEGFFDASDARSSSASDYSSDIDPSLWDMNMADLNTTSSPRPSLSLEAQALSSYTMRRRQRQALVRLQCLAKRAPDLAILIEECHPSSLPLTTDTIWAGSSWSGNGSSGGVTGSNRIEKDRSSMAIIRKPPRQRKRATR